MRSWHKMVSVLIPAFNEAATVADVITEYIDHPAIRVVVVSDNSSSDDTVFQAQQAGARVVTGSPRGYGNAIRYGLRHIETDWVLKVDADFKNPQSRWLDLLLERASLTGSTLVKACWKPTDEDPDLVTNMVAVPMLKRLYPTLSHLRSPLSGLYLFDWSAFSSANLVPTFALDVQMLVLADAMDIRVEQVEIDSVFHSTRPLPHYFQMADDLIAFFLSSKISKSFED